MQVADAWRAELEAREHETRLLEELEVSVVQSNPCVPITLAASPALTERDVGSVMSEMSREVRGGLASFSFFCAAVKFPRIFL